MPGMFIRSIPIIPPGMFLSQPPITTTPSMLWLIVAVSMQSAMTSRDTSEYFIPSVPMLMPSVTVITPNVCGMPPAARTAASARSHRCCSPALHGFIVLCPLAMPTIGLSKSPSLNPTARSIERLGERATPWVMICDRRLFGIAGNSLEKGAGTGGRLPGGGFLAGPDCGLPYNRRTQF
jgi:hypothetical protein